jgi:hypothetical protein
VEIKQLKGGVVFAPQTAEAPKKGMRLGTPGTLFCDENTGALLTEVAKERFGIPVVTHVRVIFREVEGTIYLVVAPAWVEGPAEEAAKLPGEIYPLRNAPKHPTVYKLAPLVEALKQPLRRDFWYVMESQVVNDEQLGLSVAGNWTHATLEPRELPAKKASQPAGKEQGGPKAS